MNPSPHHPADVRLPAEAARDLLQQTAVATQAGMPLDEVLIALAEETDNRRLRHAMLALAEDAARGVDVTASIRTIGHGLPRYVRHAVAASTSPAQAAALLAGLARQESTRLRLRRLMRAALIYPAVVVILLGVLVSGAMLLLVPTFGEIYRDFDMTLPAMTVALVAASKFVPWLFLGVLGIPAACLLVALLPGGARIVHWGRTTLPLLGRVWVWNAHHEFASTLGALVAEGVPLVDGLRFTADALHDRNLARSTAMAVDRCAAGAPLSLTLAESIHFDRSLTALVGWGESQDALPRALSEATALYEEELEFYALLLRRVLPPVLFVAVLTTMAFLIAGLLVPLVSLTDSLSG